MKVKEESMLLEHTLLFPLIKIMDPLIQKEGQLFLLFGIILNRIYNISG